MNVITAAKLIATAIRQTITSAISRAESPLAWRSQDCPLDEGKHSRGYRPRRPRFRQHRDSYLVDWLLNRGRRGLIPLLLAARHSLAGGDTTVSRVADTLPSPLSAHLD